MFVKIIGALAIVISCSMIGFEISSSLIKRVKVLEQWLEALHRMKSYIEYAKMPIYEIYEALSGDETEVEKFFKETLAEKEKPSAKSWKKGLSKMPYITKRDKEILQDLAENLGINTYETQIKDIEFAIKNVSDAIIQAKGISARDAKMYRSISFFAGVTIAILLV